MRAFWGYGLHYVSIKVAEWFWESQPERVKASYSKLACSEQDPKYHETRETLWEFGGTTPQG